LETSKVSLIIKGMASNLNPYIWAWPFILESCGSSSCFVFDHFQFLSSNREQERLEEQQVQYIGQLYMTMTQYHHYLENFLSTCKKNEPISLRDEKTKKIWTIFPQKHLITINALSLAECNTQLYNDLMKSFQWDVFPGGNHCLLQYVPFSCRPKKKMNPIFHLNFPGARSSLVDPGNGTTDTIYQMLVGTLELIIFERLEPQEKELFKRILQRIGFDFKRKEILLEKHLHHLEKNGFHWSTMLIQDGEFIHINKGRIHFWRVIESTQTTCNEKKKKNTMMTPCVFLTWEWVYQGVSQRGISHECWVMYISRDFDLILY
jgi:hypothetical protein